MNSTATQAPTGSSYFLLASPYQAWTTDYVHKKVKAFYGTYVIYFSCLFVLLFLVDKASYKGTSIKSLSAKLAESAEASKHYAHVTMTLTSEFLEELKGLTKDELRSEFGSVKADVTGRIQSKLGIFPTVGKVTSITKDIVTAVATIQGNGKETDEDKNDTSTNVKKNANEKNSSSPTIVTAVVTKEGNTTVIRIKENAPEKRRMYKRIKRLQVKAWTSAKKEALLQEARDGALRIDDTELESRPSFSSKIIDRLTSVSVSEYKPW